MASDVAQLSVADGLKKRAELQADFEGAQQRFYDAQVALREAKKQIHNFDAKWSRVIQLMKEV